MLPPSVSPCQSCSLTMRTALSMSQSLKMMRGDFPPSSRETFFRLLRAQLQQGITGGGGEGMKLFHSTVTWANEQRVCQVVPLHDLFADWCGASEAQLADVWVVGQTLSHHATCRGEGGLWINQEAFKVNWKVAAINMMFHRKTKQCTLSKVGCIRLVFIFSSKSHKRTKTSNVLVRLSVHSDFLLCGCQLQAHWFFLKMQIFENSSPIYC